MNRIIAQARDQGKHDAATATAIRLALRHRAAQRVWMLILLQYPFLCLATPMNGRPTLAESVVASLIFVSIIAAHIAAFITMLRLQIALENFFPAGVLLSIFSVIPLVYLAIIPSLRL